MNLSLADQYYLKALDDYPYNLELATENLQYALSYDDQHAQALCLLGQLYMYKIKDYRVAKSCLSKALKCDLEYPDTYKHLSQLYVWLSEYERAEKLIRYGLSISGMDRCALYRILSASHEYRGNLKLARDILKKAKLIAVNAHCIEAIDADINRVKKKLKSLKPSRKGKKSGKL